jgi:DNA mismatch repair protein MutS
MQAALCAAGAVLQYVQFQLRRSVDHIRRCAWPKPATACLIDAASQSHLELVDYPLRSSALPAARA